MNYENSSGGYGAQAIRALVGCPIRSWDIKEQLSGYNPVLFWRILEYQYTVKGSMYILSSGLDNGDESFFDLRFRRFNRDEGNDTTVNMCGVTK